MFIYTMWVILSRLVVFIFQIAFNIVLECVLKLAGCDLKSTVRFFFCLEIILHGKVAVSLKFSLRFIKLQKQKHLPINLKNPKSLQVSLNKNIFDHSYLYEGEN